MKELTEQEEKEYFDKHKPTLKDKMEDWFYGLIDRIVDDNMMIMILSLCTVLGILVLIELLF